MAFTVSRVKLMISSPSLAQRSHKPATPMGWPSTRAMRVGTALRLRQSSSKNACMGMMQRWPLSQVSRVAVAVLMVS